MMRYAVLKHVQQADVNMLRVHMCVEQGVHVGTLEDEYIFG